MTSPKPGRRPTMSRALDEIGEEQRAAREEREDEWGDQPMNPGGSRLSGALAEFCYIGDLAGARALLEAYPSLNLDANGPNFEIPLHSALWHGHAPCAALLLELGARGDLRDRHGNAPMDCLAVAFHHVQAEDCEGLARLLAARGAAVDEPGPYGKTPFLAACSMLNFPAAQACAALGADILALSPEGQNARELALEAHERLAINPVRGIARAELPAMLAWLDALNDRRELDAMAPAGASSRQSPRAL